MTRPANNGSWADTTHRHGDVRGVVPAVGKTLELGLGVLVVALVTSTMFGSVVPHYESIGGAEVADRSLARAGTTVESAIPPASVSARASATATLPSTIRGATYEIHADSDALHLEHPHPGVGGRLPLPLDDRVLDLAGTWRSSDRFRVSVTANRTAVTVTIGGTA